MCIEVITKRCTKCNVEQPLTRFSKSKSCRGGFNTQCKKCINENTEKWAAERRARKFVEIPKEKYCPTCAQTLSSSKFFFDRASSDGLGVMCSVCSNDYKKRLHKTKFVDDPVLYKLKELLGGARKRARKKHLPFDLDLEFIVEKFYHRTHCPILGYPLSWQSTKKLCSTSVTLDRINGALGYTKDNIDLICFKANRMKSDATSEQLLEFSKFWTEMLRDV